MIQDRANKSKGHDIKCSEQFIDMMKCINKRGNEIQSLQLILGGVRINKKMRVAKKCKGLIAKWDNCISNIYNGSNTRKSI